MSKIAIIPARGGSKRIPQKNIIDFFDKPLIAWTIEAAIESDCFDKILVSTDDEEIATISVMYGAEVPFLRNEHSDDYSPISDATISALKQAEKYWERSFINVTQLMANCPIRSSKDIKNAFTAFDKSDSNFQISCFKFGWMNPWWAARIDEFNKATPLHEKAMTSRSQDLPDLYCPTGAIWIADSSELKKSGTFYGPDYRYSELHWTSAVDIDDYDDLAMAKAVRIMLGSES